MSKQNYDMAHYERQLEAFREIAYNEGFLETPDDEIETHDHVSSATIDVSAMTSTNEIVPSLEDSDNPLFLSDDPVMIRKKTTEVGALIGVYARGLSVNRGPTIADADIADLNRIVEIFGDAQYRVLKANNKKRWVDLGENIMTGRPGSRDTNNAAAVLTRGPLERSSGPVAHAKVRIIRPGESHKEEIEFDGSQWAGTPTVAADFNIKRVFHLFVARK
jgi:hypothetical protein